MFHDAPSRFTVAYRALGSAGISKAIEKCNLIVHLITVIIGSIAADVMMVGFFDPIPFCT